MITPTILFLLIVASLFVFVLGCVLWLYAPTDRQRLLLVVDLFIFSVWLLIFLLFTALFGLRFQKTTFSSLYVILFLALTVAVITVARVLHRGMSRYEGVSRLAADLDHDKHVLEELNQQKTEFLSIASHQLRTPLSIIKGYVELIQDGAYGKPSRKLKTVLKNMNETNEGLIHLVDEFLDVTRIEQNRVVCTFVQKNVNDIIAGVIGSLKNRAESKHIKLVWKRQALPLTALDEERIRLVIFNFIDNAIKYNSRGTVRVVTSVKNKKILIEITDKGIGFEDVDKNNFFQKFYRGENVKNGAVKGTGLGLYVCRKFVEAHNGTVGAESLGLKKGSTFWFSLPIRSQPLPR